MDKNVLGELEKAMRERHIKMPALSAKLGIPKDRMYKWYQQGTAPKAEDAAKIWDWINGVFSKSVVEEEREEYNNSSRIDTLLRIIEKQQETIHYLSTGRGQGGNEPARKSASG